MKQKITYPFGWLAGQEEYTPDIINALAVEMLDHRSNLLEARAKAIEKSNNARATDLDDEANTLEKYAVILEVIYYQMEPAAWNPETMGDLLELAAKHHITLPGWMTNIKTEKT